MSIDSPDEALRLADDPRQIPIAGRQEDHLAWRREVVEFLRSLRHPAAGPEARVMKALESLRRHLKIDMEVNPWANSLFSPYMQMCDAVLAGRPAVAEPIPMVLHCPRCRVQHIDQPQPEKNWINPPHRSHECQSCGFIWRPADVATTGVASIATAGSRDSGPAVAEGWVMVPREALYAARAMANICFNLKQMPIDSPLRETWLNSMRRAHEDWDKAIATPAVRSGEETDDG